MGRAAVAPSDVPEYYVEGLGHIEPMGACSRHVLVTKRYIGTKYLLVPAVYIIMPDQNVPDGIMKATRHFAIGMRGTAESAFN